MHNNIMAVIRDLYLGDKIPWVLGYSGGKDSTTIIQLIWYALAELPEEQRNRKPIHVISTDTLVEQPVMRRWVDASLERINIAANEQEMPFKAHRLEPAVNDTFWVCMIGHGYAYPRQKYRWCTERLKIRPSNAFVQSVVDRSGEVILVLGTRKAESVSRAKTMEKYESGRMRDYLSPSGSLENQLVFSPIENWSTDDVWEYLTQIKNPWGISNDELLALYQDATDGEEIGLAFDPNAKSWGSSRFGCWMCTLVKKDKSMAAMIHNSEERRWLMPLMEFRNYIMENDRERRDFRRKSGRIHLFHDRLVHGTYKKEVREDILRRLLSLQQEILSLAPPEYKDITLISLPELRRIREIWLDDMHWFDDALPGIYTEVTGLSFEDERVNKNIFGKLGYDLVAEICKELYPEEELLLECVTGLLDIEVKASIFQPRGTMKAIEKHLSRCMFKNEVDALEYALIRENQLKELGLDTVENQTEQIML